MSVRTGLLAAIAFVGMTVSAYALPITGAFSVTGVNSPINAGVTINMASGLSFAANNNVVTSFVPGNSGTAIGGLASCFSACGTINNIASFSPFTAVAPLFTLNNGLSFDLTSLVSVVRTAGTVNTLAGLDVNGLGTYHLAGYDDTAGTFKITTQGDSFVVTFSASGQANPTLIPEPASMAVLGGALAVVGMIRRRRAS